MLWVYRSDGQTLKFDLFDEDQRRDWLEKENDPGFQREITGVALYDNGHLQTITRPARFRQVLFRAEPGERRGHPIEKVTIEAGGMMISMMAYRNDAQPKVTAIKLRKGRRVYHPR